MARLARTFEHYIMSNIMFCHFCNRFLGVLSMSYFCDDCAFLRRLYLLYDPQSFLEKVKTVFLVSDRISRSNDKDRAMASTESHNENTDDGEPPIKNFIDRRTTKPYWCDASARVAIRWWHLKSSSNAYNMPDILYASHWRSSRTYWHH